MTPSSDGPAPAVADRRGRADARRAMRRLLHQQARDQARFVRLIDTNELTVLEQLAGSAGRAPSCRATVASNGRKSSPPKLGGLAKLLKRPSLLRLRIDFQGAHPKAASGLRRLEQLRASLSALSTRRRIVGPRRPG